MTGSPIDVMLPIEASPEMRADMTREDHSKGSFVAFDFTSDALREIDIFWRSCGKAIIGLTAREILEGERAHKPA